MVVRALLLLSLLAGTVTHLAAGPLDWLLPKRDVQVIAVTDTTPAGLLRRPASPASPIYYAAISAGYRDFGGVIAGDKLPPKEDVFKAISTVLARQGYLPASEQHPPTLLLLWTWGTLNTDTFPSFNPDLPDRQVNRQQLLRFMGGYKLGLIAKEPGSFSPGFEGGVLFQTADQQLLTELASEDLYVAAIAAYDYASLRTQKVLLWTTKISCPSRGLQLAETLPAMLKLAGPYIGRETAKPVSVKATDTFKADVTIGDPQVVEYLEQTKLPVAEAPPATKSPAAPAPKKKR